MLFLLVAAVALACAPDSLLELNATKFFDNLDTTVTASNRRAALAEWNFETNST